MPDTVDTLIIGLLQWMGPNPRPYAEVLDVWRTSCPRVPVWETAEDRGFITRRRAPGGGLVSVSDAGALHLRHYRLRRAIKRRASTILVSSRGTPLVISSGVCV